MALINETNYAVNPNSSDDDLSSPEDYGILDQVDGAYGGACASSSSTMNSEHNQAGFVQFYPSPSDPLMVQDHNSLIDFNGSFLCFDQNDHHRSFHLANSTGAGGGYSALEGNNINVDYNHNGWNHHQIENIDPRILENPNYFETCKNHTDGDWLYSDAMIASSTAMVQESVASSNWTGLKRQYTGERTQVSKKPCNSATGKATAKPKAAAAATSLKDPQSIAAKNRRERISERLKILQELVPNGTKVDLVTMLEKAISYVKFLQLQVKVLATDEFWPSQGGKAPNISQVKEAIDAILSSQKGRNSSALKTN